MNVTVFGGSQLSPGDPAYREALQLGRLLAQAGHSVLTGGYVGTMEAVSRGANEAGGHVIGITCDELEIYRPTRANPWVKEEWHYKTLRERLFALIDNCQASLALPGGVGTLVEIGMTWNLMIVHAIPVRPMIVIGPAWKSTFDTFFANHNIYIPLTDRNFLSFAPDIEEAIRQLGRLTTC